MAASESPVFGQIRRDDSLNSLVRCQSDETTETFNSGLSQKITTGWKYNWFWSTCLHGSRYSQTNIIFSDNGTGLVNKKKGVDIIYLNFTNEFDLVRHDF